MVNQNNIEVLWQRIDTGVQTVLDALIEHSTESREELDESNTRQESSQDNLVKISLSVGALLFLESQPDIFKENRSASPEMLALLTGLSVGHSLGTILTAED